MPGGLIRSVPSRGFAKQSEKTLDSRIEDLEKDLENTVTILHAKNILELTNEECETLKLGDIVITDNDEAYLVSVKTNVVLQLIQSAANVITNVKYSKSNNSWNYSNSYDYDLENYYSKQETYSKTEINTLLSQNSFIELYKNTKTVSFDFSDVGGLETLYNSFRQSFLDEDCKVLCNGWFKSEISLGGLYANVISVEPSKSAIISGIDKTLICFELLSQIADPLYLGLSSDGSIYYTTDPNDPYSWTIENNDGLLTVSYIPLNPESGPAPGPEPEPEESEALRKSSDVKLF